MDIWLRRFWSEPKPNFSRRTWRVRKKNLAKVQPKSDQPFGEADLGPSAALLLTYIPPLGMLVRRALHLAQARLPKCPFYCVTDPNAFLPLRHPAISGQALQDGRENSLGHLPEIPKWHKAKSKIRGSSGLKRFNAWVISRAVFQPWVFRRVKPK